MKEFHVYGNNEANVTVLGAAEVHKATPTVAKPILDRLSPVILVQTRVITSVNLVPQIGHNRVGRQMLPNPHNLHTLHEVRHGIIIPLLCNTRHQDNLSGI